MASPDQFTSMQKRALLAELLRRQSGLPTEAAPNAVVPPAAEQPTRGRGRALPPQSFVVELSSVRNWSLESQPPYVRYVAPYRGFLYQRLNLDKTYVRGEKCHLFDADGNRYADFIAQYGALPFGHDPEPIWNAIEAARRERQPNLVIMSMSPVAGELAERLLALAPPGLAHAVFTNSGTESVEVAVKLARCRTGRFGILSACDGFHGLTLASMSATDTEFFQRSFGAPAPGFHYVPFGDLDALKSALEQRPDFFAAFLVEPIQGESGIRVAPSGYLKAALELCRRFGVLLIADEVQTGLGRTGSLFACDAEGVTPDIMALAKALGGGLVPIGACLYTRRVFSEHFDLRHGSTMAGNTFACLIALATLEELVKDDGRLVHQVALTGSYLLTQLQALRDDYPTLIADVRGRGLMIGLELGLDRIFGTRDGLLAILHRHRLLLHTIVSFLLNVEHIRVTASFTHGDVLRIEPPLIAERAMCDELIGALRRLLDILDRADAGALLEHLIGKTDTARPPNKPGRWPRRTIAATPRGDRPSAGRFAFVAHLLKAGDLKWLDASLAQFSEGELQSLRLRFVEFVQPFALGDASVPAANGRSAAGELIVLPLLPAEMMALSGPKAVGLVQGAVDLAAERGAEVVGLGGFSSVVADGGLAVKAPAGVCITSGNSFTTWAALRAVEAICIREGLALSDCTVAIVGAGGVIGNALSLMCAERVGKLILVGNPATGETGLARLRVVAADCEKHVMSLTRSNLVAGNFAKRRLRHNTPVRADATEIESGLVVTADVDRYLPEAHVVFTATNAVLPFVSARHLGKGAIVCDVSRPFNIGAELATKRPDVHILRGGTVRAPAGSSLRYIEREDEPNAVVACAAETIVLALSGFRSDRLCGRLDIATVEELGRIGENSGFSVVI
jgi:acetylornithine/succinyldiaminopimelate/putrescine aminotransferase/predicted amino acid dehydrogenase